MPCRNTVTMSWSDKIGIQNIHGAQLFKGISKLYAGFQPINVVGLSEGTKKPVDETA